MNSKEPPYLVFPPEEWDLVRRIAAALLAGARPGHVHDDDGTVEGCPGCFWSRPRYQPCRGDDVEAWLKRLRDEHGLYSDPWTGLDEALDDCRLHADTGTPLNGEVRERAEPC